MAISMVFTMKKNSMLHFLAIALVLTCLTTVAFANNIFYPGDTAVQPTSYSTAERIEDIPVYMPGTYDLGDGKTLIVEEIPGSNLPEDYFDTYSRTGSGWVTEGQPVSEEELPPVYGPGTYDLGDGVILTVEEISEEEQTPGNMARLHRRQIMPLEANVWTYFCEDSPLLNTHLKFYNYAGSPGNLYGKTITTSMVIPTTKETEFGIAPGLMGKIEDVGMNPYKIELLGDVTGDYDVCVTDWP